VLHVDCLRVNVGRDGALPCTTPATNSAPDTPHTRHDLVTPMATHVDIDSYRSGAQTNIR
jgi:hypothetical protein